MDTVRVQVFGQSKDLMVGYDCVVDDDGSVRVWDSIAGHYTRCHSMSESDQQKIRDLLKRKQVLAAMRQGNDKSLYVHECPREE